MAYRPALSTLRRALLMVVAATAVTGCIVEDPTASNLVTARTPVVRAPQQTLPYGPDPHQVADVYTPAGWSARDARPVLVNIHGGAWVTGSRSDILQVFHAQVSRGWVLVSADYRLAPDAVWPAPAHDIDRVVRWVRASAGTLGIDPTRIVIAGHSAGGHLALLHSVAAGAFADPQLPRHLQTVSPSVAGVVAVSAPSDLPALNFAFWGYRSDDLLAALFGCSTYAACDRATLAAASPISYINNTSPAAYLAHGIDDPIVSISQTMTLYNAYVSAGREGDAWFDLVDVVRSGRRTKALPATSRAHNVDLGINLTQLEAFLDARR